MNAKILAVWGANGCGKTTTSVNLAYSLAQRNFTVGVISSNTYYGELQTFFGCNVPDEKGIYTTLIPPCVDGKVGGVASIRRQKENVITRRLLIEYGSATAEELEFLPLCINNGVSLAIAGSTGSGKTTDLAYLISCIDSSKRIYTIEDTRELNIAKYENGRMTNRVVQTLTKDAPNPITMIP